MTIVIVTSLCDATSAGEEAPAAPASMSGAIASASPRKHRDAVAALQQIPRHRRPHRAETDHSDVVP